VFEAFKISTRQVGAAVAPAKRTEPARPCAIGNVPRGPPSVPHPVAAFGTEFISRTFDDGHGLGSPFSLWTLLPPEAGWACLAAGADQLRLSTPWRDGNGGVPWDAWPQSTHAEAPPLAPSRTTSAA